MAGAALLASLLTLSILTLSDYIWKADLWTLSASLQHSMQSAAPWASGFFSALSLISLFVTIIPQCVLFYFAGANVGLQLAAVNSLASAWSGLLKMAYREPRPFWVFAEVQGVTCLKDWGTPSGHALYTSAVWGCVGVYLWQTKRRGSVLWILAWLLLVGVDRLYVGAHFVSQVALGWAWGGVAACLFGASLFARKLVSQKELAAWLGMSLALMVLAGCLGQVEATWGEEWTRRVVETCGSGVDPDAIQPRCLIETGRFAFIPGLLVGYYLTQEGRTYPNLESLSWKHKAGLATEALIVISGEMLLLQSLKLAWPSESGWIVALAISAGSGVIFSAVIPRLAPRVPLLAKT